MKKSVFIVIFFIMFTSCDTKISDLLNIMERGNIICVDSSVLSNGSGESWDDACKTINEAVAVAKNGDQIWIADPYNLSGNDTIDKNITIFGGFKGNEETKAQRDGNAYTRIVNNGNIINCKSTVTFENFEISDNTGVGISFFELNDPAIVSIVNCRFENNSGSTAGIIFTQNDNTELNFINSIFSDNITSTGGTILGGGDEIEIFISNCYFANNHADFNAGIFMLPGITRIEIYNSKFENNTSGQNGGLFSSSKSINLKISHSNFENNIAGNGGILFSSQNADIKIYDSVFNYNYASTNGGIIFSNGNLDLDISDNCIFKGNYTISQSGGVIYQSVDPANIAISDGCIFEANTGNTQGGVVFCDAPGSVINIKDNCFFTENSANLGAAIFVSGNSELNIFDSCVFENNSSTISPGYHGGAISAIGSGVSIFDNCLFLSNKTAEDGGGALYFLNSDADVRYNYFFGNIAGSVGNAIVLIGTSTANSDINTSNTFGPNDSCLVL